MKKQNARTQLSMFEYEDKGMEMEAWRNRIRQLNQQVREDRDANVKVGTLIRLLGYGNYYPIVRKEGKRIWVQEGLNVYEYDLYTVNSYKNEGQE